MVAEGWVLGSRYVLRERIGGEASSVWRANDMTGWETVAVKVLDPQDGIDPQAAGRFLAHARALSALDHPAVVRVIDHGQDGGVLYQVTPYVLGESLRALLDRGGRLDATSAMVLLADLADGLNAASTVGVGQTHLSLTDVILRLDGLPVLVGLGGAEPVPAQFVLAAGRLGYECLTGAPPDDPADLTTLDQPVRSVLTRALTTDPALRFRDLPALAAAAREAAGAPEPVVATTAPQRTTRAVAAVRSERLAPPGPVPAVTGPLPAAPVPPVPPAAVPTPTAPLPTAPVPTASVPTAPAPTAPVSVPPGRRSGRRTPILVAILVLLVLAAGTTTAYLLGLRPGSGLATGDGPSSTPDATVQVTLGEPTTTASPTPTVTPTATVSPTAAPTASQATASAAPPPQVYDYRLAPLELSPVVIDGSCVFQVVYGNYGLPFAEFHQFDGDCGSPTLQIAAVPPAGDWAWHSTPQDSGTSADCGGYSWRRVVGPEGWTAFGVQVVFPRTGNTHNYGAFGTGTPPAHRSC